MGEEVGARVPVVAGREVVGMALRTRARSNPLIISLGHRISLETAVQYVLKCCRGYRLPEPTRQAHTTAGSSGDEEPETTSQAEASQPPTLWDT